MTIRYDESQVGPDQIIAKVEKAGFGAAPHPEKQEKAAEVPKDDEAAALKRKKLELITAGVFSLVLLYVSMGQMLPLGLPALPLPDLFSMHTHPVNFAILQLLLTIPVLDVDDVPDRLRVHAPSMQTLADTATLGETEKAKILATLKEAGGNRTRAAKMLGISRRTIYRKLDEYAAEGEAL